MSEDYASCIDFLVKKWCSSNYGAQVRLILAVKSRDRSGRRGRRGRCGRIALSGDCLINSAASRARAPSGEVLQCSKSGDVTGGVSCQVTLYYIFDLFSWQAALTTTSFDKKIVPGYNLGRVVVSWQAGTYLDLAPSFSVIFVPSRSTTLKQKIQGAALCNYLGVN